MACYVDKFGGTSLADGARMFRAAEHFAALRRRGHRVVGVLSARAGDTDALLALAREIRPDCGGRELDALLSTGEQCSTALCAMALERLGCPALSLTGWQAGLETDGCFGRAEITGLNGSRIRDALDRGLVVLTAGFQGISPAGDITTLGRGGSDITAVALAALLPADHCRIFTDVEGVYDRDPRRYPHARKFQRISYDEMLALSQAGAKVLHPRCVEMARAHGVSIEVRSAFRDEPGTLVE